MICSFLHLIITFLASHFHSPLHLHMSLISRLSLHLTKGGGWHVLLAMPPLCTLHLPHPQEDLPNLWTLSPQQLTLHPPHVLKMCSPKFLPSSGKGTTFTKRALQCPRSSLLCGPLSPRSLPPYSSNGPHPSPMECQVAPQEDGRTPNLPAGHTPISSRAMRDLVATSPFTQNSWL